MKISIEEMDFLARKSINPAFLRFERSLFETKWFDYRFMHPYEATIEFIKCYNVAYNQVRLEYFGEKRSDWHATASQLEIYNSFKNDFKEGSKLSKQKMTTFWRARQFADMIGMPYRLFVELAYEGIMKYWKKKTKPYLTRLYARQNLEFIKNGWEERKISKLYFSDLPHYSNEKYCGSPPQVSYKKFLKDQITARGFKKTIIDFFIEKSQLDTDDLKEILVDYS